MLREHVAPQPEVMRVIVLGDSPCCGGAPRLPERPAGRVNQCDAIEKCYSTRTEDSAVSMLWGAPHRSSPTSSSRSTANGGPGDSQHERPEERLADLMCNSATYSIRCVCVCLCVCVSGRLTYISLPLHYCIRNVYNSNRRDVLLLPLPLVS